MKRLLAVLLAFSCVAGGAFAEVLLDLSVTAPITGGFLSGRSRNEDSIDVSWGYEAKDDELIFVTTGIGTSIGAVFIGDTAPIGFGMKIGLDFPLYVYGQNYDNGKGSTLVKEQKLKPGSASVDIDGGLSVDTKDLDIDGLEYSYKTFGIDGLLGPALRLVNTNRFSLILTPGLAISYNSVEAELKYKDTSLTRQEYGMIHFGAGVDAAGLFNITDMVYAKFALYATLGYTYGWANGPSNASSASIVEVLAGATLSEFVVDAVGGGFGLTFRPELGIGFRL